ncbi:hypothetical protein A8M78_28040, partial [Escherichia coli]
SIRNRKKTGLTSRFFCVCTSSPDSSSLTPVEYFLLNFTKIRQMGDIEYIYLGVVGKNQLMFDSQKQALEVQKVICP